MKPIDLRELQALNTLVFETLGKPEKEREFNFGSLKRWGLDLLQGKKNGETTFFTCETGKKKKGDSYSEGDNVFQVDEILEQFPKNKKLFAHIRMKEGIAYLYGELRENDQNLPIIKLPAASILLSFLKKHKLMNVIEAVRNVGTATELVKQRGQEGKPITCKNLPNIAKKFLTEAKKIEKEANFGRIAVVFYGKNKDGKDRFRLSWLLPTIALFEINIAEKIDKALEIIR